MKAFSLEAQEKNSEHYIYVYEDPFLYFVISEYNVTDVLVLSLNAIFDLDRGLEKKTLNYFKECTLVYLIDSHFF